MGKHGVRKKKGWRQQKQRSPATPSEPREPCISVDLKDLESPSLVTAIGTLEEMAPLMWSTDYRKLRELQVLQLEGSGRLVTAAQQLQGAAPISTYKARGLSKRPQSQVELRNEDRTGHMASMVLRQGNMRTHTFTCCVDSLAALARRVPDKMWNQGLKHRQLLARSTTRQLLRLMMQVYLRLVIVYPPTSSS